MKSELKNYLHSWFNPSPPSVAHRHQWTESAFVQIMDWRLVWTIAGILSIEPLGKKISEIFYRNSSIFIQENAFESVVCEITDMLSRPQCVLLRTTSSEFDQNNDLHSWFNHISCHLISCVWYCWLLDDTAVMARAQFLTVIRFFYKIWCHEWKNINKMG